MIINDLANAYDKLIKDANCEINQNGFCYGVIENLVVIDENGKLCEIITISNTMREKLPENLCPGGVKKNLLYDTFEYFFGLKLDNSKFVVAIDGKSKDKVSKYESFKSANLELLKNLDCKIAGAIAKFLVSWNPSENLDNSVFFETLESGELKPKKYKGYFAFCLLNVNNKSYLDKTIIEKIEENISNKNKDVKANGVCCITGEIVKIADKHKSFSGSQNYLISVDNDTKSFHSYGKNWCYDSPVSEEIMNKYTAVLNYFYRSGSKNKASFGEDVLMFWADSSKDYQDDILMLLGQTATQDVNIEVENKISSALDQIKQGITPTVFITDSDTQFYLLLLSKNAARFTVKNYHRTTFGTLRDNVLQHYLDMEIVGIVKPIPIWQILNSTVSSTSSSKPNPNFNSTLTNSIINNRVYPTAMFSEMILRIKTDNSNKPIMGYLSNNRIALIKAYLVRKNRLENKKEDIKMSLNIENKDEAYLLGRLFAVMEKTQQDAIPGLNSTIKDRYFASACSTPASVFPTLLVGYQNHIGKIERGKGRYEKLVLEIIDKLGETMPKQLDLDSQGRFIIGYYQQVKSLWTKQTNTENENKEEN